jgi:hypothetical protein
LEILNRSEFAHRSKHVARKRNDATDQAGGDKRRTGRKKVGVAVNLRISRELRDELAYIARALELDQSSVIRMILAEGIVAQYRRAVRVQAEREEMREEMRRANEGTEE